MRALLPSAVENEARELVTALELRGPRGDRPRDRPRVVAVMIASADGRASVAGRSAALGHPEDRALLRELRTAADAVLVGSVTLRAERYGRLLDADQVAWRSQLGLSPHPLIATISRDGSLDASAAPVLSEPGVPVVVYPRGAPVRPVARGVGADGGLLTATLRSLRRDHDVQVLACEGGPTLLRALAAEGLVDDLLLTVAPTLVGGDALTITAGEALGAGMPLHLRQVHQADDHLFLHYAVGAGR